MKDRTQVLVVGGGPAGSTVATLLARNGLEVTLAEREVFPRYHIGESLLPSCLKILELMGMRGMLRDYGFQRKEGVYFEWGGPSWEARFLNLEGIDDKHSYQVSRAEFDQLLLEHAKTQGVDVHEGTAVKRVELDGERPVRATCVRDGVEHTIGFDLLVDASGRSGLMANRHQRDRVFHQAFRNVAVWGYWRDAGQLPTDLVGATGVCAVPDGWFWAIPLRDGTVSLGLVLHRDTFHATRGGDLRAFYLKAIDDCPTIRDLVKNGTLVSDVRVEQDYSYASDLFAGPGYFISGDAACFLDPLLSTGVHLAQYSAVLCAASICSLVRGEVTEEQARAFYHDSYRQAYLRFFTLVSAYYQQYGGQRTYFWEAQQLTARDYDDPELSQAFLNIITGIEDFKDAEASAGKYVLDQMHEAHDEAFRVLRNPKKINGLSPAEQERAKAKFELLDRTAHRFSLTEDAAVHGLYAVLEPLGLAQVKP